MKVAANNNEHAVLPENWYISPSVASNTQPKHHVNRVPTLREMHFIELLVTRSTY